LRAVEQAKTAVPAVKRQARISARRRRPGRDFRLVDFEPGSLPLCQTESVDRAAY
jgi:hypothetical protein